MTEFIHQFFLAFIPLFVAVNVLGIIPMFISLTDGQTAEQRNALITQATLTCFAIAVLFLILGRFIFSFLGITEADFRIGGGILLLVFAISDLLFSSTEKRRSTDGTVGVVPIGIPLIMGPAAMTTILILMDSYGPILTILSIVTNLIIVWVLFRQSHWVNRIIGSAGSKAVGKVAALFLAAIGVMMIRVGFTQILALGTTLAGL